MHHPLLVLALLAAAGGKPVTKPAAATPAPPPRNAPVTEQDLAARFKGNIAVPGVPLNVIVSFEIRGGALAGTIDIPAQNLRGFALSGVKLTGDQLAFSMAGVPGTPSFSGTATRASIKGTFTQGGSSLPFELLRISPREEVAPHLADWDAFVEGALKDWMVPGVAMALVRDGEVVLQKGWGFRDVEKKQPVTEKTLFAIGSCTKAFTTAVMAGLVDEGKLDWETPVQRYMPQFRLKDEYASSRMTARDLVTHVSGLPRHDLSWYANSTLTRDDLLARLPHLEPNKSFRQEWQYNNLMYITAGALVEQVSGKSWERNVRDRVLGPLQMLRSNFSVKDLQKDADHAEPYAERKDQLVHIPYRDITNAGPAGSINSSVEEMARWVRVHLEGGSVNGTRVLSAGSLAELHVPRAVIASPPDDPSVPLSAYASGWLVDVYRGHRRIHHGGAIDGFTAMVMMFPDSNTGVVVLVNRSGANGFIRALTGTLSDRLLGLPARDWNKEGLEKRARNKGLEKEARGNKAAARVPGTGPSRKIPDYAGRYVDAGYGPLDITHKDGALVATYNGLRLPLEHWHYDTFRVAEQKEEPDFEGLLFTFITGPTGDLDAVESSLEATASPIRFKRGADPRLEDPAFLARLAGEFEVAGKPLKVDVRGKVLTLAGSSGVPTELVPSTGLAFTLKGLSIVRVVFVLGDDGRASELRVQDPGGQVTATRKK